VTNNSASVDLTGDYEDDFDSIVSDGSEEMSDRRLHDILLDGNSDDSDDDEVVEVVKPEAKGRVTKRKDSPSVLLLKTRT
jgi:hypothetical protein